MSRQFRYRVAALVLGGLLLGGPLVASGSASAEQVGRAPEQIDTGGRQVIFDGGGVFGFSCRSSPDIESMSVPAESTVRIVNRTGHSANLQLGGDTQGMLPNHESTEVVFHRGTTAMTLTPICTLGNDAMPVLITAQPSAPATTPDPISDPAVGDSSASTANQDSSSDPSDSMTPNTVAAPAHPHRTPKITGRPMTRRTKAPHSAAAPTATVAAQGLPPGARVAGPKSKIKTEVRTPGSAAPTISSMPVDTAKALVPGVPEPDVDPATQAAAAAVSPSPTEIAAAEPVAAMEPMREQGPTGLLAAIAAVLALGVGVAAIRAFVSQRANRSKVA